jgi:hypothetical protein
MNCTKNVRHKTNIGGAVQLASFFFTYQIMHLVCQESYLFLLLSSRIIFISSIIISGFNP